jgi:hypothetical protein
MNDIHSRHWLPPAGGPRNNVCLPSLVDAVGNAGVIQQHIKQDGAMRQLMKAVLDVILRMSPVVSTGQIYPYPPDDPCAEPDGQGPRPVRGQ